MENKFSFFARWWRRFLKFWNRQPLRAQGGILVLIPLFAALVSFGIAFYGNRNREWIQADIQRKFQVVRELNTLEKTTVDAETGMRGYALTKRTEFLEPYNQAVARLPQEIEFLRELIAAEPGEKPRLEKQADLEQIQFLLSRRLTSLAELKKLFEQQSVNQSQLYIQLQDGKKLMDEFRLSLEKVRIQEENLLNERVEEINKIRRRDYFALFITLSLAFIVRIISFYLFDRGIVRRLNRLTENVKNWRASKETDFPEKKKDDAIGLLEQEIEQMAQHFKNQSKIG